MIHWIVTKKIFDLFIMFVIVLSSIALAAEDPVSENSERNKVLGFADYWFTAIFTLEVLLKVNTVFPRIISWLVPVTKKIFDLFIMFVIVLS